MKARCRQETSVTLLGGEKLRKRIPEPQVPDQERIYVLQVAVLEEWGYPSPPKFRYPKLQMLDMELTSPSIPPFWNRRGHFLPLLVGKLKRGSISGAVRKPL